jgi:hypothetical protein
MGQCLAGFGQHSNHVGPSWNGCGGRRRFEDWKDWHFSFFDPTDRLPVNKSGKRGFWRFLSVRPFIVTYFFVPALADGNPTA